MGANAVANTKPSMTLLEDSFVRHKKPCKEVLNFRIPQVPIQVIVGQGEEKATFIVYRDFLVYYSRYFSHALTKGHFKEADGVVEIEHISSEIFGLFVEWLYTQRVKDRQCKDMSIKDKTKREANDKPTMDELVSLWILADYLQCPRLQNQAMDLIISKNSRRTAFNTSCISSAYENTVPESPLRKVFVDICFWNGPGKSAFLSHSEDFPKELLLDLVVLYSEKVAKNSPLDEPSNYHVKE